MINFNFTIRNPWSSLFTNLYSTGGALFGNKFWEFQVMRTDEVISIETRFTTRQDHAGIDVWIALFSFAVNFKIYDNRHWDYEKKCWVVYDETGDYF